MPRGKRGAVASAAAPEGVETVYGFTHAKRDEVCVYCREVILKHDLHARSTNGKRRICCSCWDKPKKRGRKS